MTQIQKIWTWSWLESDSDSGNQSNLKSENKMAPENPENLKVIMNIIPKSDSNSKKEK